MEKSIRFFGSGSLFTPRGVKSKNLAIIALVLAMAIVPGAAYGQELPKYPIHDEEEQFAYDSLATTWDDDSVTVRQCALDRLKERHITKTYLNLVHAFISCYAKEDREKKELDEQ
jgi:hypothetical protein